MSDGVKFILFIRMRGSANGTTRIDKGAAANKLSAHGSMPDQPVLDNESLRMLQQLGENRFVHEMVSMFFGYADDKLSAAREALSAEDIDGVEKAIHPLKTSAGHVGALVMKQIAQQIERLARDGEKEAIPGLLSALEQAYSDVKPLLEARLQDYPK